MSAGPMPMTVPSRTGWSAVAPLALLLIAVIAVMHATVADMVHIWIRSETFTHAFLVPPITLWLAWRRRAELASLPRRTEPWLLLPIALAALAWLLGELASVATVSQFALVTIVILAVPTLLGRAVARALTFPLAFLYFAVPFGEFAVPQLMEWTADFTVLALRFTGLPVYREGLQFVIPSGTWSVVEACSGVRYLIASFMVGSLFAYLNYRSTRRRVIFALVSLAVPVLANWLRAYMIVMIGHLSGNELAVGVDHLVYGWVFFGLVIGAMFWIGARWAEPDPPPVAAGPTPADAAVSQRWAAAGLVLALVVGAQAWAWRLDHPDEIAEPRVQLPAVTGYNAVSAAPPLPWHPGFHNPNVAVTGVQSAGERTLWTWVGYYRQQGERRKLVSSINGVTALDDKEWSPTAAAALPGAADRPTVVATSLRRGGMLATTSAPDTRMRVWHLYWIDGRWTVSATQVKVRQAIGRLLGRGDDGAVVMLAVEDGHDADAILEKFARAALPGIGRALAVTRDTR